MKAEGPGESAEAVSRPGIPSPHSVLYQQRPAATAERVMESRL